MSAADRLTVGQRTG